MPSFDQLLVRASALVLLSFPLFSHAQEKCAATLLQEGPRVEIGSTERALKLPLQLGFVERTPFQRTIERLRPMVQRHFIDHHQDNTARWLLSLVQIVPISTSKAVASFYANETAHASPFSGDKYPRVTVNVVFHIETGEIQSHTILEEGALGYPGAEVRLSGKAMGAINAHAKALPRMIQRRDYQSSANAKRAEDHTRIKVGRTFGAKNDPTMFVEVTLDTLLEQAHGGGLYSRHYGLVYTVEPSNLVRLRAVDHEELAPFVQD